MYALMNGDRRNTGTIIDKWSKVKVRGVVTFSHARGENSTKFHLELGSVYSGKLVMSEK